MRQKEKLLQKKSVLEKRQTSGRCPGRVIPLLNGEKTGHAAGRFKFGPFAPE